ncbi:hypothetical protein NPIL_638481 [Nephila pilipes]|uniref:Uncharacterized protein n=1 Tax=Nephila pilipes TaxID=299642 RepID=A0A8X6T843_NEPPI|nr:hypothetical protein NPIL_638481 [Nephila pilipes]
MYERIKIGVRKFKIEGISSLKTCLSQHLIDHDDMKAFYFDVPVQEFVSYFLSKHVDRHLAGSLLAFFCFLGAYRYASAVDPRRCISELRGRSMEWAEIFFIGASEFSWQSVST